MLFQETHDEETIREERLAMPKTDSNFVYLYDNGEGARSHSLITYAGNEGLDDILMELKVYQSGPCVATHAHPKTESQQHFSRERDVVSRQ